QPDGATGTYYASTSDGTTWHLVATGTMGAVSRTITANATPPSSQTTTEAGVWNYVYADSVTTCMTITGGVTVSVPILSRGNICLTSGGHFINPGSTSTATLIAGGTV